jgi:hypothetical protein
MIGGGDSNKDGKTIDGNEHSVGIGTPSYMAPE